MDTQQVTTVADPHRGRPARGRRRLIAAGGALLLLAGGVSFVVAVSATRSRPTARVVGGNVPVDGDATNPLTVAAYNSPALVADPRQPATLAIAARVDVPQFSCAVFVSTTSGATWERRSLPAPPDPATTACYSPDVTFGADGALFASFGSIASVPGQGNAPAGLWVTRSTDQGRTFSLPARAAGPLAFQATLVADRTVAGRVYLTWVQVSATVAYGFANPGNPIMIARSDDGGTTWRQPVALSAPARQRVIAPVPTTGGAGSVYVAYLDVGNDSLDYLGAHEGRGGDPYPGSWTLVVARSGDGGSTWTESAVDEKVIPTQRVLMLFPPLPSIAVDPGGHRIYVGMSDGRSGDPDVRVWTSTDGARHWAAPVRVNDTRSGDGTSQYLPGLAVAPDGRVDVVYYDRREDSQDVMNTVSFQSSYDGGRTFTHRLRLTDRSFDSRVGLGSDRGLPDLGDRLGIVSTRSGALAIWADTRAGAQATGKQDLGRALVATPPPPAGRGGLAIAGAVMVLLGAVALGSTMAARRTRARPGGLTAER